MSEEKYEGLLPRFLKYVKTETRSNPDSKTIPSDPKETAFLNELKAELISLGLSDVHINPQSSYLVATIPSNIDKDVPTVGFIAISILQILMLIMLIHRLSKITMASQILSLIKMANMS